MEEVDPVSEQMVRIVINGVCGRMGREVAALALEDGSFSVVGAFEDVRSPFCGRTLGEITGRPGLDVEVTAQLPGPLSVADAVIDFSGPGATLSLIPLVSDLRVPLVIGTTGFSEEERTTIEDLAGKHAIVFSPNMSQGVNVLFGILPSFLDLMGEGWDVEVMEQHHRGKIDAPSGTAMRFGDIIAESRGKPLQSLARFGREGKAGPRTNEEICFHSVRGGNSPGTHTLVFSRGDEEITIKHAICGRGEFARGALLAARLLVGRRPGLYALPDLMRTRGG